MQGRGLGILALACGVVASGLWAKYLMAQPNCKNDCNDISIAYIANLDNGQCIEFVAVDQKECKVCTADGGCLGGDPTKDCNWLEPVHSIKFGTGTKRCTWAGNPVYCEAATCTIGLNEQPIETLRNQSRCGGAGK